jgi:hypothetical protein
MDATAGHRRADRIAFDAASNARQRSCASKSGFQRSAAYEPAGRVFRIRVPSRFSQGSETALFIVLANSLELGQFEASQSCKRPLAASGARPLFPGTMAFDDIPASIEHIRAGKLRALGVATAMRSFEPEGRASSMAVVA